MGGRARLRVIATLAAVLALDSADKGTIGATAGDLQRGLSVGATDIGLLITLSSLVGAALTVPFGALVDRVRRTRLLVAVIGLWGVAMLAGATATSYAWLLSSRIFLGAVTAAAYPAVASLVGDWFPARERAGVLGLVLTGELVGAGLGIAVAGGAAALSSWRVSFALMAVPAVTVAWFVGRLPEPARGAMRPLLAGQEEVTSENAGSRATPPRRGSEPEPAAPREREGPDSEDGNPVRSLVSRAGVEPDRSAVVRGDLRRLSIWAVLRYVLRVRTNVFLIIASALGYYMFAGVRAFGVEFADQNYGVGQGTASALVFVIGSGAVVGVVTGGRIADRLLDRGHLDARIVVPIAGFVALVVVLAPAVVTTSIAIALPLLVVAGFFLAITNPPLDAARLDVIPASMWGRAEAVRTVLRTTLEALAPLVFGIMAEHVFSGSDNPLRATFLVMLIPLLASPAVLVLARRSYTRDVATAAASSSGSRSDGGPDPPHRSRA